MVAPIEEVGLLEAPIPQRKFGIGITPARQREFISRQEEARAIQRKGEELKKTSEFKKVISIAEKQQEELNQLIQQRDSAQTERQQVITRLNTEQGLTIQDKQNLSARNNILITQLQVYNNSIRSVQESNQFIQELKQRVQTEAPFIGQAGIESFSSAAQEAFIPFSQIQEQARQAGIVQEQREAGDIRAQRTLEVLRTELGATAAGEIIRTGTIAPQQLQSLSLGAKSFLGLPTEPQKLEAIKERVEVPRVTELPEGAIGTGIHGGLLFKDPTGRGGAREFVPQSLPSGQVRFTPVVESETKRQFEQISEDQKKIEKSRKELAKELLTVQGLKEIGSIIKTVASEFIRSTAKGGIRLAAEATKEQLLLSTQLFTGIKAPPEVRKKLDEQIRKLGTGQDVRNFALTAATVIAPEFRILAPAVKGALAAFALVKTAELVKEPTPQKAAEAVLAGGAGLVLSPIRAIARKATLIEPKTITVPKTGEKVRVIDVTNPIDKSKVRILLQEGKFSASEKVPVQKQLEQSAKAKGIRFLIQTAPELIKTKEGKFKIDVERGLYLAPESQITFRGLPQAHTFYAGIGGEVREIGLARFVTESLLAGKPLRPTLLAKRPAIQIVLQRSPQLPKWIQDGLKGKQTPEVKQNVAFWLKKWQTENPPSRIYTIHTKTREIQVNPDKFIRAVLKKKSTKSQEEFAKAARQYSIERQTGLVGGIELQPGLQPHGPEAQIVEPVGKEFKEVRGLRAKIFRLFLLQRGSQAADIGGRTTEIAFFQPIPRVKRKEVHLPSKFEGPKKESDLIRKEIKESLDQTKSLTRETTQSLRRREAEIVRVRTDKFIRTPNGERERLPRERFREATRLPRERIVQQRREVSRELVRDRSRDFARIRLPEPRIRERIRELERVRPRIPVVRPRPITPRERARFREITRPRVPTIRVRPRPELPTIPPQMLRLLSPQAKKQAIKKEKKFKERVFFVPDVTSHVLQITKEFTPKEIERKARLGFTPGELRPVPIIRTTSRRRR